MTKAISKASTIQKMPGFNYIKHNFVVPLAYGKGLSQAGSETINVFARELYLPEYQDSRENLPFLVFFQGGPGFESPRPLALDGWIKRALQEYRVLLLDQRGVGNSSAIGLEGLLKLSDYKERTAYLSNFRADSIVKDSEMIRRALIGDSKWTTLGQSFGGFITTTYLSYFPEGLEKCFITGGLPPLASNPDEVYRALYPRVIEKNALYRELFPEDHTVVKAIVQHLLNHKEELSTGEILSARRFLGAGLNFGYKSGGFDSLHYLLERAFEGDRLSYYFKRNFENLLTFNTNIIYAILHEAIYCQGSASNWSAERLLPEFPQFDLASSQPLFTGEMIYRFMFDEYACLKPLKDTAQALAKKSDWPNLYDREALQRNQVPVAACLYYDDMYVDRALSLACAATISGAKTWITNEYEHDGLRRDGENILNKLITMVK